MSAGAVLVVGGDGMIGAALAEAFRAEDWLVYASTRRSDSVDMKRPFIDLAAAADEPPELPDADVTVLAAAVARIGDCEADPEGSRRINVDGTLAVARAMARRGSHVILLSTDKVFDGALARRRHNDATCPQTAYGQQKAAAEMGVLALGREPGSGQAGAVLRLTKVLEPDMPLLAGWVGDLRAGRAITPFHNLHLAPIGLGMVAGLVGRLAGERAGGVFHCSGAEDRSYVDLARQLAAGLGLDAGRIEPAAATDTAVPAAARVAHTTLDMELERSRWGIPALAFDDCVEALLTALPA